MKQGRKPSLKQMKIMQANGMTHDHWLVSKVFPDHLLCIHKDTNTEKKAYIQVMAR